MPEFEIDVEKIERLDLCLRLSPRRPGEPDDVESTAAPVLRWLGDQLLVSPRLADLLRVAVYRTDSSIPLFDGALHSPVALGAPEKLLGTAAAGAATAPATASERHLDVVLLAANGDGFAVPEADPGPTRTSITFVVGSASELELPRAHRVWGASRTVALRHGAAEPLRRVCESLIGRIVSEIDASVRDWAESGELTAEIGESGYAIG